MASHLAKSQKSQKSQKNSILAENSNSCRMADSGRIDDIWPEIDFWEVRKCFFIKIHHIHWFWTIFRKIEKNWFFRFLKVGSGQILAESWFFRTNIGQMIFLGDTNNLRLLSEKNGAASIAFRWRYPKKYGFSQSTQKRYISHIFRNHLIN